ncbi:hybrid sensor histidine kinase/response regulator [Bradyrhizobium sp. Leo170]|nr:hybrid sensor histidine kinase/response regulator [Bradyrhizobium sp. Leo170]
MTLLSRLFLLVAIALIPAIAIQAYNEFQFRCARQVEVQNQALNLAELAAAEQRQIVQGMHQALIALSELPAIKAKNPEGCNAYLARIKRRYPGFISFIVVDTNGDAFCDTNNDQKRSTAAGRPYFADVLKTGKFTVGEFAIGRQTGRKVLHFALSFYGDDARLGGVVIAALSLDWLAGSIAQQDVPPGAALAIMDRNGTYLARYPDNDRFVSRRIPGDNDRKPDHRSTADIVDLDGVERIVGYSVLQDGGLVIAFGLDKARAFTEIQHGTQRGVFLIVLSTALVLSLTSLGARRFIHRPLEQLVDAANQWRLGDLARRVDIQGTSEIIQVAEAFNTMADALQRREHELSEAKERAEEAAARFTMIFENTTDSVLIVDRDWRVSYLNGPASASVAHGRDIVGMALSEAFPVAAELEALKKIREATSERRPTYLEMFCPRMEAWYAINAFPSSHGLAIFLRDITDHKQALEERRLMEEQLHQSQKMEAVGQLTGGVAHDFNNLLTVISANLELIEDAPDIGKIRQYAAAARRSVHRGTKLTTQLLAFSRGHALKPELVNANRLLSEFQGLIRQAVGNGCEVELRLDEALWMCRVDPSLLETALLNLALNARDAMPDGGVLRIETRNMVQDKSSMSGCPPGSYVRLSVADTGCGMSPEVRDRVFEPFFTTKDVGKGTGLGLSMVYGFVRQSGGHIAINSAPGAGTTIDLYLPSAAQAREADPERTQPQAIPTGTERILLVEDNEDLLEATSAMLTTCGYQVSCARNGMDALRILQSGQDFELLLSDIVMPNGMSGVELAREARKLGKDIRILLASGYAADVLERHNAVGEFPIVEKPFRLADLARRLHAMLNEA